MAEIIVGYTDVGCIVHSATVLGPTRARSASQCSQLPPALQALLVAEGLQVKSILLSSQNQISLSTLIDSDFHPHLLMALSAMPRRLADAARHMKDQHRGVKLYRCRMHRPFGTCNSVSQN